MHGRLHYGYSNNVLKAEDGDWLDDDENFHLYSHYSG